ncbi:MAG: translation initiation factor 2 [Oscillospiraceae bacterium]
MVKGLSHRVIVVKSPDAKYFEEAIFVIREDVLACRGADTATVLNEARRVANSYVKGKARAPKRLLAKYPAPLFAAAGAAATGIAWLAMRLCGV